MRYYIGMFIVYLLYVGTADRGKCQGLQCSMRSCVCVCTCIMVYRRVRVWKTVLIFPELGALIAGAAVKRACATVSARWLSRPQQRFRCVSSRSVCFKTRTTTNCHDRPSAAVYRISIWTVNTMRTYALLWPLAAFLVTRTSGSAIPMWEFLSRGEKVTFGN